MAGVKGSPPMSEPQLEDVVTHKELAEFLGITERSLGRYRIPSIEIGKQRLYFKGDVAQWLRSRRDLRSGS